MGTERGSKSFNLCPQSTIGNDPAIRHNNGWPLWTAECMLRDDRGYCCFNKSTPPPTPFDVHWFSIIRVIRSRKNSYCILATFILRGKDECSKRCRTDRRNAQQRFAKLRCSKSLEGVPHAAVPCLGLVSKLLEVSTSTCPLMGWSGRAPAPPVTNLARGCKDKEHANVPEPQQRNYSDRH